MDISRRSIFCRLVAGFYRVVAGLAVTTLVCSCVIVPDQRHLVDGVVLVAPPPPLEEVAGPPPVAGDVWLPGYWQWVGNRHQWVGGRWAAPRPGRQWVPYQWVRQGDGWRLSPGHWERVRS
jgi:hypothetical protein